MAQQGWPTVTPSITATDTFRFPVVKPENQFPSLKW